MAENLGERAVRTIYDLWQVDADRSLWGTSGFDWWPGHFKQSVRCSELLEVDGVEGYRLTASTDVLRNTLAAEEDRQGMLDALAKFAPSYTYRVVPQEVVEKYDLQSEMRTLSFDSTAFVHEENVGWLPHFFGQMALLQPVDAQIKAKMLSEMLGGDMDWSSPHDDGQLCELDGMLEVVAELYAPMGQEPSRWSECDEFERFAEEHARSDGCFGHGDLGGLTLETPFGEDSALIRLRSDQPHPQLGNGLLVTLQLPITLSEAESREQAIWYNFFESVSSLYFPLLGSWCTHKTGARGFTISFSSFIPNALFRENLASNAAFWMLGRARWIRTQFFPDLHDLTMAEILNRRFGGDES